MALLIKVNPYLETREGTTVDVPLATVLSCYQWLSFYDKERQNLSKPSSERRRDRSYMQYLHPGNIWKWRGEMVSSWRLKELASSANSLEAEWYDRQFLELRVRAERLSPQLEIIELNTSQRSLLHNLSLVLLRTAFKLNREEIEQIMADAQASELKDSSRDFKRMVNGKELVEVNAQKVFIGNAIRGLPLFSHLIQDLGLHALQEATRQYLVEDVYHLLSYESPVLSVEEK